MPRPTIPIALYIILRPLLRAGIILSAVRMDSSANLETRELTGGFGALRCPRWSLDVERSIMWRTIESRYGILQCVLEKIATFYKFDRSKSWQNISLLHPSIHSHGATMHAMVAANVELSV